MNKFAHGVLPERMDTFATITFKIDSQIIHGFTFRSHLLSAFGVRYMVKKPITLFKDLCALRIKENVKHLVWQLASLQWSHIAKMA